MAYSVFVRCFLPLMLLIAGAQHAPSHATAHTATGPTFSAGSTEPEDPKPDPAGTPSSAPPSPSSTPPSSSDPTGAPTTDPSGSSTPPRPGTADEPSTPSRPSTREEKSPSDDRSTAPKSTAPKSPPARSPVTVKPEPPRPPVFDPAELTAPDLPSGPGGPVEPDILVSSNSQADAQQVAQQAQTLGLTLISQNALNSLNIVLSKFRTPQGLPSAQALVQLRNASPGVVADLDTAYALQQSGADPKRYGRALLSWPDTPTGCAATGSIGMIDTAVDVKHPAFQGRQIVQRDFVPEEFEAADSKHGTGVAGILLGQYPKGNIEGYVPQARLFSASVFYGDSKQSTTNTELIVNALDWLGSRFVSVINLSFAGKGDVVLEQATEISASQNRVLIAAAGNFGPKAKPAFPAAYPHVLAVTAVDSRKALYKAANIGDYIDFAAPGVDIWTAAPKGKGAFRSGTSFASPAVASILLMLGSTSSGDVARKRLMSMVVDLDQPGRDPLFGYGLAQAPKSCS